MACETLPANKKKKIKGQIPGGLYAWIVSQAEREKRRVSEVLHDLVVYALNADFAVKDSGIIPEDVRAASAHTYLNFNADPELLARWESFKAKNNLKNDSQTIRIVATYCYRLSKAEKTGAVQRMLEFR